MKGKILTGIVVLIFLATLLFPANSKTTNFKTATFAVCKDLEDYVYCEDKIFAACNGEIIEIKNRRAECNGKVYEINETGFGKAYFSGGWKDPRAPDFITIWATG